MIFLSECIICKGKRKSNFDFGITIVELDDFEQVVASDIWKDTDVDYSQESRHVLRRKISENSCLGLFPV